MILSCDDGCASDVRLAELCDRYEMDCVFYWPVEWRSLAYDKGYTPLKFAEALNIARRYEIGSHTVTHRHLTALLPDEAMREVLESKFMLERLFARRIDRFAPPRGYTNDWLSEYTLQIYFKQRLTRGKELVHVHPDSGANNNRPWRQAINENTTELWMHSWELDKYNLWDELESYLKELSNA